MTGLAYGVGRFGARRSAVARVDGRIVDVADLVPGPSLNQFMAAGREAWRSVHEQVLARADRAEAVEPDALVLPFEVADYVDFYSSEHHAANLGGLLRPGTEPLPPAWRHLPIGYHGRSATIVVSGTAVERPHGIVATEDGPRFGPTQRLDVEVEVGFVVGVGGRRIPVEAAAEHVFGAVLVNDWSARDVQAFEYQPLGPFLGKSFATSVGAWVVPLDALAECWVDGPPQDPPPLPHLACPEPRGLDLALTLEVNGAVVSRTNARHLYWSMAQQLAHLTSNGALARTGDLFATGTVSGPEPGSEGSLFELWRGERWLADGDTVVIRGDGPGGADLGQVTGTVV